MSETAQKRAVKNYRRRLAARGMARFEVVGLDADRELIRSVARRLAENDVGATRLRRTLGQSVADEPPARGGILAALRASPLVGAGLDLRREKASGRKVDL